jgi:pre-mRNA-splicing helicase BRR2
LAGDRQARASTDDMDVDDQTMQTESVPKTATLAPGSTVQPNKTLDLESMMIAQGGNFMSNKKCKLPDRSFRRAQNGYEEIHISAPKQKPVIVSVSALPFWCLLADEEG